MAVFTITSFSTFAGLILAAQKLATAPDPINGLKALADLATSGKALADVLGDAGLTPLAQEMARQAEEHARHITHPGAARDDALALFWQVAPEALADPAAFAAGELDPDRITERMVAAIRASPHARDFAAAPLAEPFFRAVTGRTLAVMLDKADVVAGIAPALWREILRRHGMQIELLEDVKRDTAEILALVRELHAIKATTVPEDTLIAMARKISPRVADRAEALRVLDNAADIAAQMLARGRAGSNVDEFVDTVLHRLAMLTSEGRLDEARVEAVDAVDRAEAGLRQLLDAALDAHLLAFDAKGAAQITHRRILLEIPDPAQAAEALLREQNEWHQRGRNKGLNFDVEVSIELARRVVGLAANWMQRGIALTYLGNSLQTLGEREIGLSLLEEAVVTFREVMKNWTRERVPNEWAGTQSNLGNTLTILGDRDGGTERLKEAAEAINFALTVWSRENFPYDWAGAHINLGNVRRILGERNNDYSEFDGSRLSFQSALTVYSHERYPIEWAKAQHGLGTALSALGERDGDAVRLGKAVTALRFALEERTRERLPLGWAMTQNNLGNAYRALASICGDISQLDLAIEAFDAALEERTRDRVPLEWAATTGNRGVAMFLRGEWMGDVRAAREAVEHFKAASATMTTARHAVAAAQFTANILAAEALVARLEAW